MKSDDKVHVTWWSSECIRIPKQYLLDIDIIFLDCVHCTVENWKNVSLEEMCKGFLYKRSPEDGYTDHHQKKCKLELMFRLLQRDLVIPMVPLSLFLVNISIFSENNESHPLRRDYSK